MNETQTVKEPLKLWEKILFRIVFPVILGVILWSLYSQVAGIFFMTKHTASTTCLVTNAETDTYIVQPDAGAGQSGNSTRRVDVHCNVNVPGMPSKYRLFGNPWGYMDASDKSRSFDDDANSFRMTKGDRLACGVEWLQTNAPFTWEYFSEDTFGPQVGLRNCHLIKK